MNGFFVDLRSALRLRLRNPRMLGVEIATLTIGLTLVSVTISIVNALIAPPAFRDAHLVVGITREGSDRVLEFEEVPYSSYRQLTSRRDLFQSTAAFRRVPTVISTSDGRGGFAVGEAVTGGFFELFDLTPAAGQLPRHDGHDAEPGIVLSHNAWHRLFRGEAALVGARVMVGTRSFRVVGITPPSFTGVFRGVIPDFWIPLHTYAAGSPAYRRDVDDPRDVSVWVVGRLLPHVNLEDAQQALARVVDVNRPQPGTAPPPRISLVAARDLPIHPALSRQAVLGIVTILLGQIVLVLLITGANVATITSIRTVQKHGGLIVRLALGATSTRILRLLIAENCVLVAVATVLALTISWAVAAVLSSIRLPVPLPIGLPVSVDSRAALLTIILAFGAATVVAIICAAGFWSTARSTGLYASAPAAATLAASRHARLRHVLVGSQIALSLVMVGLAALAFRGLQLARSSELGFDTSGITVATLAPALAGHTGKHAAALVDGAVARMRQLPGVDVVTTVQPLPLSMFSRFTKVRTTNNSPVSPDHLPFVATAVVGPGYFDALRIPLISGREFTSSDDPTQPKVVIVNRSMAAHYWPSQNPVGLTIGVGFPKPSDALIVGVVADTKISSVRDAASPAIYSPTGQDPTVASGVTLLVRASGDLRTIQRQVIEAVRAAAPGVPVFGVQTLQEHVDVAFTIPRFALTFFAICGVVAILFAGTGLYGVIALFIQLQTREIGIRLAIGADTRAILTLAFRRAVVFGALGLCAGVAGLLIIGSVMARALSGLASPDALTVTAAIVVTGAVTVLATCGPAHRAIRADPMEILRYQ